MRAAAALELGELGEQSETERSGTVAATESLRSLVALLQHGYADGKANSPFVLGKLAADGAHRGLIGAADAIGLLVAMLPHGDADGKANARHALDR